MKQQFMEWMFVLMACVFAIGLPFMWIASPTVSDALKISAIGAPFIAISCYLGIRARRQGSHKGYIFKLMLPLILLGISMIVVLTGFLLNVRR
jgi:hypothetical protein